MPQPMSLERYAELTARMACGEKRSDVLESVHIDIETWEASQQYWLEKMAAEAGRERYSLAQRYGALFKTAQQRALGIPLKLARWPARSKKVVIHAIPATPAAAPQGAVAAPPPLPSSPSALSPPSAPRPVPPPSSLGAYTARLTLEQLAAMRAEIGMAPDAEQPGVMQRFGLDPATWEQEEAHWQRRLAGDQDLFKRYLRQFQYCRSLLQRV
jgi:hypothetical protein